MLGVLSLHLLYPFYGSQECSKKEQYAHSFITDPMTFLFYFTIGQAAVFALGQIFSILSNGDTIHTFI